jgi:hypothetical protein
LQTCPETAASRIDRRELVRAALLMVDPDTPQVSVRIAQFKALLTVVEPEDARDLLEKADEVRLRRVAHAVEVTCDLCCLL